MKDRLRGFMWGLFLSGLLIKELYGSVSKPWYLVNPKIAGKWMFIPLKMVLIGIDPYPYIDRLISGLYYLFCSGLL